MTKFFILPGFLAISLLAGKTFAQEAGSHHHHHHSHAEPDSAWLRDLQEVIVVGQLRPDSARVVKALSSLDHYLEESVNIDMIKRGAYAWEPMLHGMTSERSLVTIDGMRIYGACTDKMDPVSSYVDITNLAQAKISHGQSGASGGSTIAGSIDLLRKKGDFSEGRNVSASLFTGFESSNLHKIAGGSVHHSAPRFFADLDFIYRDAENYKAGGREEILYSQFTKYNLSGTLGYKINDKGHVEGSVIFDRATDVGYPALPMDVSLAQALITSLSYHYHPVEKGVIKNWETKLYYNSVTHTMDDTQRPEVPIRMDMPGWTKTAGFYSRLRGATGRHEWTADLSGHYNNSLAEMTMFSNNAGEKDMFMYTWPDVNTFFGGLFLEDKIKWASPGLSSVLSVGASLQHNAIQSRFGLNSLKIFYPEMEKGKSRLIPSFSKALHYETDAWLHTFRIGYGQRAPSVSEEYGFYLFNSSDRFDYIGNPGLKNEKSLEAGVTTSYRLSDFSMKAQASYFHIMDYIIGRPRTDFAPMTIGASGVKVYEQLPAANVLGAGLELSYRIMRGLQTSGKLSYKLGRGPDGLKLPLMQPFSYAFSAVYKKGTFTADAGLQGAAAYTNYNPEFGEMPAGAYYIINLALSKSLLLGQHQLNFKGGVENLLDRHYTTFADWNRIPRMGRNLFLNVIYSF